jgi:methyl-accepting chemotaxis protein
MFLSGQNQLLCIKCFHELKNAERGQCADIETAYNSSCEVLAQSCKSVQQLLQSLHEAIGNINRMVEQLHSNADKEKADIESLHQSLMEALEQEKMALLDTAEKKQDNKEKALREQLESLNETVPQIQTHLSMCKKFTETANKHELLHLYHDVVGHLDWLLDQPYDLTPVDDSHVETNMKDEFARCLQPLLMDNFTGASPLLVMPRVDFMVSQILSTADFRGRNSPAGLMSSCSSPINGHGSSNRRVSWNMETALQGEGPFAEHCKQFNPVLKKLQQQMIQMKETVQDLHRDLTRRRCQPQKPQLLEVLSECKVVESTLSSHCAMLEHLRSSFEKVTYPCDIKF